MKKEFIVERQGKNFVLYAGLLDLSHQNGLSAIETRIIQTPEESNHMTAICTATVTMEKDGVKRTFTGIGDAAPNNVAPAMKTCLLRMAETRAKSRALRDAVNVGVAAFEELGDDDATDHASESGYQSNSRASRPTRPVQTAKPADAVNDAALTVVQGGKKTGWQLFQEKCASYGYAGQDSAAAYALADEILKDATAEAVATDDYFGMAAGENSIAWETALETLKAKKQANNQKAVAR